MRNIDSSGRISAECFMFNGNVRSSDDPVDPDKVIVYYAKTREYGLPVYDGKSIWEADLSYMVITLCPWCGNELPVSLRDRLFEEGELLMGTDDFSREDLPEEFQSDAWWRDRGL
jgi:hypothetical protein